MALLLGRHCLSLIHFVDRMDISCYFSFRNVAAFECGLNNRVNPPRTGFTPFSRIKRECENQQDGDQGT
jgi:hypothetical protein